VSFHAALDVAEHAGSARPEVAGEAMSKVKGVVA
jgi:hypothetical protein